MRQLYETGGEEALLQSHAETVSYKPILQEVFVISDRARLGYRYGPRYSKFTLLGKARLIQKGAASTIKNASTNSKDC
jgi:hypothetical protein